MVERKIVVVNDRINQEQKDMLLATAAKYGAKIEFYKEVDEAIPHINNAEIIFGISPELIKNAPELKWFCSASAGIDHYIRAGAFDGRAYYYGVTDNDASNERLSEDNRQSPMEKQFSNKFSPRKQDCCTGNGESRAGFCKACQRV